jgi:hypothetical protein
MDRYCKTVRVTGTGTRTDQRRCAFIVGAFVKLNSGQMLGLLEQGYHREINETIDWGSML